MYIPESRTVQKIFKTANTGARRLKLFQFASKEHSKVFQSKLRLSVRAEFFAIKVNYIQFPDLHTTNEGNFHNDY